MQSQNEIRVHLEKVLKQNQHVRDCDAQPHNVARSMQSYGVKTIKAAVDKFRGMPTEQQRILTTATKASTGNEVKCGNC